MSNDQSDILSEEHTTAIGALVVNTSKLESVITDLIAVFLETDIFRTVIVAHHQQFASKVDCLLALMDRILGESGFETIYDDIKAAKKLSEFRNTVVHALWSVDKKGDAHAVRFQARGKFTRSRQPMPASKIQQHADEALALTQKLAKFRDHMLGLKKPDPQS